MERKTKFGHQHGDHIKNFNPYRVYKQRMRRLKYPFIAVGVLLLFFVSFDVTGEFAKTDVLNAVDSGEEIVFTQENLEVVKKGMLLLLNDEIKECEDLGLAECVTKAKNLTALTAVASTPEEVEEVYKALENAVSEWNEAQEKAACEKDREDAVHNLERTIRLLKKTDEERALKLQSELEDLKGSSPCS